ncbi:MAG TPA: response regulator [Roseiarcus sp.]|nr:response regulator [Roseiarcus sp.]
MGLQSAGRQSQGTVLVVEDEFLILMDVSKCLRDAGYGVIEASNVAEARTALHSWSRIDIAVLDIRLPEPADGVRLVKWIRANRPEVEAIIATGYEPDEELRALAPIVAKPYRSDELLGVIRKVMAKRRQAAEEAR